MKRLMLQMRVPWLVHIAHGVYSLLLRLAVQILSRIKCSLASSSIRFPNFLVFSGILWMFVTLKRWWPGELVLSISAFPSVIHNLLKGFLVLWTACCAAIWAQKNTMDRRNRFKGHMHTLWGARYITPCSSHKQNVWQCTDTTQQTTLDDSKCAVHKSKHRKNF